MEGDSDEARNLADGDDCRPGLGSGVAKRSRAQGRYSARARLSLRQRRRRRLEAGLGHAKGRQRAISGGGVRPRRRLESGQSAIPGKDD